MKSSWLAWKRAFLKELREPDYEDRLLNRWLECRQQGDESVLKYMQRYETAVYRVKDVGAIQSDRFEAQKVSRFIEGLRMRYRAQVSSSRPRSLEAAFSQALRLEKWTEAEEDEGLYGGRPKRKNVNALVGREEATGGATVLPTARLPPQGRRPRPLRVRSPRVGRVGAGTCIRRVKRDTRSPARTAAG